MKRPSVYDERREAAEKERARCEARLVDHVAEPAESRSWKVTQPGRGFTFGFFVTWAPGMVQIHGDVGELTIKHYSACRTLRDAVAWVRGASGSFDYFLGNSTAARDDFSVRDSLRSEIALAYEYARQWNDFGFFEKLYDVAETLTGGPYEVEKDELERSGWHRATLCRALLEVSEGEISEREYIQALYSAGYDEPRALTDWNGAAYWQWAALRRWADLVVDEVFADPPAPWWRRVFAWIQQHGPRGPIPKRRPLSGGAP